MRGRSGSRWGLILRSFLSALWFSLMFFLAIPGLVLWAAGASLRPEPGPPLWLGLVLIAAAHVAIVGQVALFIREGRGTQAPFDPPRELVVRGLYHRLRNPMYALYALVILGEAVCYRSGALLAYTLAFGLLANGYVVAVEEKQLRRRFGADYQAYCRRVPRWWPRLG